MNFVNNRAIARKLEPLIMLVVAGLISGCSLSYDSLLPTLTGEDPSGRTQTAQVQP